LEKIAEEPGIAWLREHLERCVLPLLKAPWILDVDTTIAYSTAFGHAFHADSATHSRVIRPGGRSEATLGF
jgi:hypothetical protein